MLLLSTQEAQYSLLDNLCGRGLNSRPRGKAKPPLLEEPYDSCVYRLVVIASYCSWFAQKCSETFKNYKYTEFRNLIKYSIIFGFRN